MLARKPGYCRTCAVGIHVGDEIAVLVGQWVHQACKGAEIARRAKAAGEPVVLELVMPDNELITYVGTNQRRRKRRSPRKTLTRR